MTSQCFTYKPHISCKTQYSMSIKMCHTFVLILSLTGTQAVYKTQHFSCKAQSVLSIAHVNFNKAIYIYIQM